MAAWREVVIYVISPYAGSRAAQVITKCFLLSVDSDGQAPYLMFLEDTDHEDGCLQSAQLLVREHTINPAPVEKVLDTTELHTRKFKRRFRWAIGSKPIRYIRHLRNAKDQPG